MTLQIIITLALITFVIHYFIKGKLDKQITENQKRNLDEEVKEVLNNISHLHNKYIFKTIPLPEPEKLISDVLFGKIEMITENYYIIPGHKDTKTTLIPLSKSPNGINKHGISIIYDDNNQIIKNSFLNIDGTIEQSSDFIYNNKILIKSKTHKGKDTTTTNYFYDNQNRICKIETHLISEPNKIIQSDKYNYDNIGNCISRNGYNTKSNYDYSIINYFNEKLMTATETSISMKGTNLNTQNIYKTNGTNKLMLIKQVRYIHNKKAYEIFYDEQSRITKSTKYNNDANIEISYYEYNKDSIITNIKTFENDFLSNEMQYDDLGNVLKEIIYHRNTRISPSQNTYEYIYDQNNNWVERKENSYLYNHINLTKREIMYK